MTARIPGATDGRDRLSGSRIPVSNVLHAMTDNPTKDRPAARSTMLAWAGIGLGSILMVLSARGDLWLDEIWSIFFAEAARSPCEILTLFRHDNNHVLNTLYLYAI